MKQLCPDCKGEKRLPSGRECPTCEGEGVRPDPEEAAVGTGSSDDPTQLYHRE
jgi:DnaJ-class molecular chaperone